MRTYTILTLVLMVLASCQSTVVDDAHVDHIGCAPQEITIGSSCALASQNKSNADLFTSLDESRIMSEEVEYAPGIRGFVAKPSDKAEHPAIIMIHEWWGLNDHIKTMAKLLAQEGYVVLAVDLYEGSVAKNSDEAGRLAGDARNNPDRTIKNMRSAVTYLKSRNDVQIDRIASMGWCFGGQQSLLLAMSGESLQATVIYYGQLTNESEKLSAIKWPVLGIFGEKDTGIPPESVRSFESALNSLNITNDITIYPGVGHAFANPSGARYAPNETIDAWHKTVAFLNANLKQ